ncbi:MAG: efflux RND transporter periplasmic adaptor subunit [Chloroherpetonaceae bacterium]|nr:efflux RND transporter periplasmic adaptor subunit [Chloroherpetonaceae bacterium]
MRSQLLRYLIGTILIIVVLSCSKETERTPKTETALPEIRIEPLKVKTEQARKRALIQSVTATGVCEAIQRVQISARIAAELQRLDAKEGQYFRAGDTLLKLNDREYRITLQEAKDDYLKTQSDYATQRNDYGGLSSSKEWKEKLNELRRKLSNATEAFRKGEVEIKEVEKIKEETELAEILAGEKLDDVLRTRTGFSGAKTRLQRAELNFQNTAILAPFDGYASGIRVSQGQVLSIGQACMEFVNLSRIRVEVGILEKEIPMIKIGNRARIILGAFSGDTLIGNVTAISPVISLDSKTAKAVIELPNTTFKIRPGMYATVLVEAARYENKLVVSKRAILERDGRKIIFVLEKSADGKELAKWNYVVTGLENETEVEIKEGIKAGDEVIVENNFTLSHDMPVTKIP